MSKSYTHKNLEEVNDDAAGYGMGEILEGRFAYDDLHAEATGVSHQRIHPHQRLPFGHRHEHAEEVYVVIAGSGRAKLDDDIIDLATLDALRVAPGVTRGFEAGPDGLEVLAFGPRHEGDGEVFQGWWND